MPSVVFTTEEVYDNILFGVDGLIGVASVGVVSAEDVFNAVDSNVVAAVAGVSADEVISLVAEDATVTAVAQVSADAGGQVFGEAAVVTSSVQTIGVESADYIDAIAVSALAVTSSSDVLSRVDGAVVSSVAAHVALERAGFADSATLATNARLAAAEVTVFLQTDLFTSAAISAALDVAGLIDAASTLSSADIVAQEVYTSGGNTFNTYTDADTSVGNAAPTALDGRQWTDVVTVSAAAAPSSSLDNHVVSDSAIVTVFQAVSAINAHIYVSEATTVTAIANSTTSELLATVDSATMQATASPSAIDIRSGTAYVDAATVTANAIPSSTDTYVSQYAFFDSFIRNPVSGGWGTPSGGGNPWVVINGQDPDFSTTGTLGKIVVANTSGHEVAITVTGTGSSKYNIGQFMQWQWNTTNNGTLPVQIGGHLYWVDETNRFYYRLLVGQKPTTGSLQLSLDKVIAGGTTAGLGGYNIITSSSSLNTYYNLRTEGSGLNTSNPTLKGRLWLASAPEPTTWGFTYTDTSGAYPALNANYGFRTNIFSGDTNNPTLKFSQYYGYYL